MMAEAEATTVIELQEPDVNTAGAENPAFEAEVTEEKPDLEPAAPEVLPPLTYIDFAPQCLGTEIEGAIPNFDSFKSVVEQANQWLTSMPQFYATKCETVTLKLGSEYAVDNDQVITHVSSGGKNNYIRLLRLWLQPRLTPVTTVQQLAYITVFPDHKNGDLKTFFNNMIGNTKELKSEGLGHFDTLSLTIEKLNKHLSAKPLPGSIISAETLPFKCNESSTSDKLDSEASSWTENGTNLKLFLTGIRVFYVLGQPAHEALGMYNQAPEIYQSNEMLSVKVKFSGFSVLTNKAGKWLQGQAGIRVVNTQSVNMKMSRKGGSAGPWDLNPDLSAFEIANSLAETRFCKVLRIIYTTPKTPNALAPSPSPAGLLTSRIFVPGKLAGRSYESFSKTMLRVIKWLGKTRLPVFACESVQYMVNTEAYEGSGFQEDRTDSVVTSYHGRYYVTCIRLYFNQTFEEPPEEIEENVDVEWGWRCVVS